MIISETATMINDIKSNIESRDMIANLNDNNISVGDKLNGIKSKLHIGNLQIYTTKSFNRFQKYIWKKILGIKITELDDYKLEG